MELLALLTLSVALIPAPAADVDDDLPPSWLPPPALVLFLLYSRHTRTEALDHPLRRALHEEVGRRPDGATASALAEALGANRKTAEYHLRYLARLGLVQDGVGPGGTRVFSARAREAPPAPTRQDLRAEVARRPGISTGEVADALGVSYAMADHHLKTLVARGALRVERDGDVRRFFPDPQ